MNPDNTHKYKIIGLTLLGLLFVGTIIFLLSLPSGDEADKDTTTLSPANNQQEVQAAVSYHGFADLSRRGLTSFQMDGIKYALYQYAGNASTYTIDPSTITQSEYDKDNPAPSVQLAFTIRIDDKSYDMKVDKYTDLVTVRVYLYASDSKLIYDSQPLDSRKLRAANDVVGD